jgi:hypothetical protein
MTRRNGHMRQTATAEVRLDDGEAIQFQPCEAERLAVSAVSGSARSNFIAAAPAGTENRIQQAGNPGDVG